MIGVGLLYLTENKKNNQLIVYDKVSWHYPEGKKCKTLDMAKKHISLIMNWLLTNNLLSDEGKEILNLGISSDFSITSLMLTPRGNKIMKIYYPSWLKTINYSSNNINTKILDDGLKKIK